MVVYCSGNTSRGQNDFFKQICCLLKESGHTPICHQTVAYSQNPQNPGKLAVSPHLEDARALTSADLVILEVSAPACAQVGWELSRALSLGKPVVACYQKTAKPDFILGIDEENICWCEYDRASMGDTIKRALSFANLATRIRFNLTLSSKHYQFLEKVAKHRQIAKANVVRQLLDQEMTKH